VQGQRPDVFVVDDRTMIDQHLASAGHVIGHLPVPMKA
jgi:hypothetical protein